MKELKERLDKIADCMACEKEKSKQLLKDYIQKYGEIDWIEEQSKIETTFYGVGYYTAEVERVWIDEEEDELVIDTTLGEVRELDGDYTNDTILDILYAVISNASVLK